MNKIFGIEIGYYFLFYITILSIISFFIMRVDKNAAKKKRRRVPEKSLFLLSLFGGSIGTFLGMYIFRHKTKHWYFVIGIPLILVFQIIIVLYLLKKHLSI